MATRVRGAQSFKRLMERLPQEVKHEIVVQMNLTGQALLKSQKKRAPVLKQRRKDRVPGAVREALRMKVTPNALRLQVGLVGKPVNRRLFYAYIVQMGRRAQVVTATRRGVYAKTIPLGGRSNKFKALALRNGIKGAYKLRITALPKRNFIYWSRDFLAQPFQEIWERALTKAAAGAGHD